MDLMGHGIALDQEPHSATADVMPGLGLNASDIFSLKDGLMPIFSWRIECRIDN